MSRFPPLNVGAKRGGHKVGEVYVCKLLHPVRVCLEVLVGRVGVLEVSERYILLPAATFEHVSYLLALHLTLHFQ